MKFGEEIGEKEKNEAIKSTKEIFKKKSKDKAKKVILQVVKAIAVPVLLMLLKILIITILITSIISAITVTIFGDDSDDSDSDDIDENKTIIVGADQETVTEDDSETITDPQTGISSITIGNRTYKNYKQIVEEYKNIELSGFEYDFPNTNLCQHGCAVVSTTIIATGFGHDVNPISVNKGYQSNGLGSNHAAALNYYTGLTWNYVGFNAEGVKNQLNEGYPVVVHVNSGPRTSGGSHYFTILGISSDKSQVYVSDPAMSDSNTEYTGWLNINILNEPYFDMYYNCL